MGIARFTITLFLSALRAIDSIPAPGTNHMTRMYRPVRMALWSQYLLASKVKRYRGLSFTVAFPNLVVKHLQLPSEPGRVE